MHTSKPSWPDTDFRWFNKLSVSPTVCWHFDSESLLLLCLLFSTCTRPHRHSWLLPDSHSHGRVWFCQWDWSMAGKKMLSSLFLSLFRLCLLPTCSEICIWPATKCSKSPTSSEEEASGVSTAGLNESPLHNNRLSDVSSWTYKTVQVIVIFAFTHFVIIATFLLIVYQKSQCVKANPEKWHHERHM